MRLWHPNPKMALAACMVIATAAPAFAIDQLYTPYVEKGEWEVEYFGSNSFDNDDEKDSAQNHEFAIGYGVTDYWQTELNAVFEKEPQDHVTFDAWEWENILQFTGKGEYWVDAGISLGYEHTPQSSHTDAVEARLLLASDIGHTTHILNLVAEKEVGPGDRDEVEGALLWSSRYRCTPYFQPGFEISSEFGELENTGSFDEQEHYIGPAAYGTLPLGEGLGYRAAYLFGVSDAATDGQLLLQLEYELEF